MVHRPHSENHRLGLRKVFVCLSKGFLALNIFNNSKREKKRSSREEEIGDAKESDGDKFGRQ